MSYISAIRKNNDILVWERTNDGRVLRRFPAPFYFFVEDPKGKYLSIFGDSLSKYEFTTQEEFQKALSEWRNKNVRIFESDIPAELKLLSKEYYNVPAHALHITFLDIEVDYNPEIGFASVDNTYAPINSIAMFHTWEKRMVRSLCL